MMEPEDGLIRGSPTATRPRCLQLLSDVRPGAGRCTVVHGSGGGGSRTCLPARPDGAACRITEPGRQVLKSGK